MLTKIKSAASTVGHGLLDATTAVHNATIQNRIDEIDKEMAMLRNQMVELEENKTKLKSQMI